MINNGEIISANIVIDTIKIQNNYLIPTDSSDLFLTWISNNTLRKTKSVAHSNSNFNNNFYHLQVNDKKYDNLGNVYIGGHYSLQATFGSIILPTVDPQKSNFFITKIDTNGNVLWCKWGGGNGSYNEIDALSIDLDGNVYVAGQLYGYSQVDTFLFNCIGQGEAFVAKYDKEGNLKWASVAGYGSHATDIIIANSNKLYLAGRDYLGIYITQIDSNNNTNWLIRGKGLQYSPKLGLKENEHFYIIHGHSYEDTIIYDNYGDTILPKKLSGTVLCEFDNSGKLLWFKEVSNVSSYGFAFDNRNYQILMVNSYRDSIIFENNNVIYSNDKNNNLIFYWLDTAGNYKSHISTTTSAPPYITYIFPKILINGGDIYLGSEINCLPNNDSIYFGANKIKTFKGSFIWNVCSNDSNTICSYNISPQNQLFNSNGGNDSILVSTDTCSWSAISNNSWITITSGLMGNGIGTVYYSVDVKTTSGSRTGTILAAGDTFIVNQTGPTAINELTKNSLFSIFPNPVQENFTIELPSELLNSQLKIFNVLGENVLTEKLVNKKQTINCKTLPKGIYFYKITDEKKEMIGNGKLVIADN